MDVIPKAEFTFVDFKINSFEFDSPKKEDVTLSVGFKVSGIFFQKETKYNLSLEVAVMDENEKKDVFVKAHLLATFKFAGVKTQNEIPEFFFANSIAIVSPYLRAFISNLSLQANWKPMILPLLNLTHLSKTLKDKTSEVLE